MTKINPPVTVVTPFKNGTIGNLQKRKNSSSGITFDLKAAFDGMVKAGALERTNKTFSKEDGIAMFNKLNEIHKKHGYSTDYSNMKKGQEYSYTGAEFQALAEAAGYRVKGGNYNTQDVASLAKGGNLFNQKLSVTSTKLENVKIDNLPTNEPAKWLKPQSYDITQFKKSTATVNGEKKLVYTAPDGSKYTSVSGADLVLINKVKSGNLFHKAEYETSLSNEEYQKLTANTEYATDNVPNPKAKAKENTTQTIAQNILPNPTEQTPENNSTTGIKGTLA